MKKIVLLVAGAALALGLCACGGGSIGKYLYTDEELALEAAKFEDASRYTVQRYKGLGEMDPEQLWETTMEPESRTLRQVTIDDLYEVDRVVNELMGNNVECRKEFITSHAADIDERFLDI